MYISGQIGLDTTSGQLVEGGVQAQAKQVGDCMVPMDVDGVELTSMNVG